MVGSASAGLIAALSLKRKIPQLDVTIVRSPEIGVIGVGEGTTPNFPTYLFEDLGISASTSMNWRSRPGNSAFDFLWGPRGRFDYTFAPQLRFPVGGSAEAAWFLLRR